MGGVLSWRNLLGCAFLLILSGCATYSDTFRTVEVEIANGRPEKALKALESNGGATGKDQVLYLLNKGVLLRMQKDYSASNATFEQAKQLIVYLSAASISEQAGAVAVNDAMRSFVGDPYEQVLLHLVMAFNYLDLGELDSARVEVLQVDVKLREIAQKRGKSAYREDAFARYLAGVIYEELREWSDATISYRKAYQIYVRQQKIFGVAPPESLKRSLLRMLERQGINDELRKYQAEFGIKEWDSVNERRDQAHLVFILSDGLAPIKREQAIHAQDFSSGQLHRIAVPYYESRPYLLGGMRVRVNQQMSNGALVEDIEAIARKTLDEQMPGITARAVARAVLKSKSVKEVQDRGGALAGLLMNVATVASERADTRSWVTLPSNIYMAELSTTPGRYDVEVEMLGPHGGRVDTIHFKDVEFIRGRNTYLFYHWLTPAMVSGGRR